VENIQIEDVEVLTREKPRMSYTPYQGRSKWRSFNRDPRVIFRGNKILLNENNATTIANAILQPVLEALGAPSSKAYLVLNSTGGDNREPVLELKRVEGEEHFPRADIIIFVKGYNQ
jgi:hypothetical protein